MNYLKFLEGLEQRPFWQLLVFWAGIQAIRFGPGIAAFVFAIGYMMSDKKDFFLVWLAIAVLLLPDRVRK